MKKCSAGIRRRLYLRPRVSRSCRKLLVAHYRSRIALIDKLLDDIARLYGIPTPGTGA
jgi:hypothetical protein